MQAARFIYQLLCISFRNSDRCQTRLDIRMYSAIFFLQLLNSSQRSISNCPIFLLNHFMELCISGTKLVVFPRYQIAERFD